MVNLKEALKDNFMLVTERDNELNKLSDTVHTHTGYVTKEEYNSKQNCMNTLINKIQYPDKIL